jgi:hypothetical protein
MACSRGSTATATATATTTATTTATPTPPSTQSLPRSGEAIRSTLARLEADPLLIAQLPTLREHFGADPVGPFEVERVTLAGGAAAMLVSKGHDTDPIVLVVDRDRLLWTKKRPVAGILPPVRHLAIAPRPDGGVVVFAWVESLATVAARMWADDSNPFGDFEVFAPDRCDALSAGYAPGFGWVVVCTAPDGARGARMTEDITMPWGHRGVPLGATSAAGPATVAFDSPSSFVLLQRAASARGERVLAYRLDGRGMDLWATPVALDGVGVAAAAGERIRAESLDKDGVLVDAMAGKAVRGQPYRLDPEGTLSVSH